MPSPSMTALATYVLAPSVAIAAGGVVAAMRPPTAPFRSSIQHFAAGIVFSAAAVEVLPGVLRRDSPLAAAAGFASGVVLMLAIRGLTRGRAHQPQADETFPWSLAIVVGVDIFIDGILIGVMLTAGHRAATLVTIALCVELFSLGLSVVASSASNTSRNLVAIGALSVVPAMGALSGWLAFDGLQGAAMEAVLAFAVAALLYLVTEELLVEAHEVPETPVSTATFFAGFLGLMLLDMMM